PPRAPPAPGRRAPRAKPARRCPRPRRGNGVPAGARGAAARGADRRDRRRPAARPGRSAVPSIPRRAGAPPTDRATAGAWRARIAELAPAAASRSASAMTRPITPADLWRLARVGRPVPLPGGGAVVVGVTRYDVDKDEGHERLWLVPVAGAARPLTAPD